MSALRAFAVTENDENTGAIYFAKHDIVAKRWGANEYGDGELSYVSCRRAPWADEYASKPLPAWLMIANGWHFECHGCGMRLDEDELRERHLPVEGVLGSQHSLVFCSARCRRKDFSRERRRKAEAQRAIEALKAIVRNRFPQVSFTDEHDNPNWQHHAYVTYHHRQRGWFWEQVSVSFTFPGMQIAPATLRLQRRWSHTIGPVMPEYSCCNGDLEAFQAYAAATRVR